MKTSMIPVVLGCLLLVARSSGADEAALVASGDASTDENVQEAPSGDLSPTLWNTLVAKGAIDPNATVVQVPAELAGLPTPFAVQAAASDAATSDATATVLSATTQLSAATVSDAFPGPGLSIGVHGSCVDSKAGTAEAWDAIVELTGEQIDGGALSENDAPMSIAGSVDGRTVNLTFVWPTGVTGAFTGVTQQGYLVTGSYVAGDSTGTCSGELSPQ